MSNITGFSSPNHFNRIFSKQFNMSPTSFMKMHAEGKNHSRASDLLKKDGRQLTTAGHLSTIIIPLQFIQCPLRFAQHIGRGHLFQF
ncbi:AraC family transcriptional regulator [Chitinophaga sedimenti]|uniref:AraC family transcriptional regulator n=1 Tax=Chitinophaga sedimenti TaxID=2033606 RepID=UPI0020055099|nr:AraC family transcriptional regulator [Chitinophaga sedimenti]MCK7557592.1 AraC family transcriptional regulator [Chitinophaga sedimenti]